jgi:anti-sigma28 factor (negative regulator of flagellin synthesis)
MRPAKKTDMQKVSQVKAAVNSEAGRNESVSKTDCAEAGQPVTSVIIEQLSQNLTTEKNPQLSHARLCIAQPEKVTGKDGRCNIVRPDKVTGMDGRFGNPEPDKNSKALTTADNRRLSQLRERIRKGHYLDPVNTRAVAIADKFKMSFRNAYRYAKRGTEPQAERVIGKDGKWHPAGGRRIRKTPLEKNLRLAWQALNRAERIACESGFHPGDLELLARIAALALDMETRWNEAQ